MTFLIRPKGGEGGREADGWGSLLRITKPGSMTDP